MRNQPPEEGFALPTIGAPPGEEVTGAAAAPGAPARRSAREIIQVRTVALGILAATLLAVPLGVLIGSLEIAHRYRLVDAPIDLDEAVVG